LGEVPEPALKLPGMARGVLKRTRLQLQNNVADVAMVRKMPMSLNPTTSRPPLKCIIMMATYNEAGSIPFVLTEVAEAVEKLAKSNVICKVLLVDDKSPDQTAEIAKAESARLGIDLEILSGNKAGLGQAVLRGFAHGLLDAPDFFVTLDADGQHDARQMPDLVRAYLANDADIMIGSRWTLGGSSPGTTAMRSVLSRGGNQLFQIITGTRGVQDATTSFRVIRAEVARKFSPEHLNVTGYAFFSSFIALAHAHGFRIGETPIVFRPRYSGMSKLTLNDCTTFFKNLFKLRAATASIRTQRAKELRNEHAASARSLGSNYAGSGSADTNFPDPSQPPSLTIAPTGTSTSA
jgi:dolichol-phosphate mannosyltransferase